MKKTQKENKLVMAILTLFVVLFISIPIWMSVGKYQLCKYYFPEINRMACLVTQLPGVTRK